jgi:hypothetical protein
MLCSRQFGKSVLVACLAIEDCLRVPDSSVMIIGPTLKQTRSIVGPRIKLMSRFAPPGLIRPYRSEGKWLIGDSEIVIGGFDTTASSERGKTLQKIYVEEVVGSDPDQYHEALRSDLGPALTHAIDGKIIYATTLPKIPDHPFITETIPEAQLADAFYSYTIHDNKALTREQYNKAVRRCGGENTVDFKREYLNQVVRDPSVVIIPDYNDDIHSAIFEQPTEGKWHVTIDFGGVRDKTVALLHTYDFYGDRLIVWDERHFPINTHTGLIAKACADMAKQWGIDEYRFAGDAPGQVQVDLAELGYNFGSVKKDDWQASINRLQIAFSLQKALVHRRCEFLRTTLRSGTFNKSKTDFHRSEALGHMDAIAAMMYGNQLQDRTSPYQTLAPSVRSDTFMRPKPDPAQQIVDQIIPPTSFRQKGIKRFGQYR